MESTKTFKIRKTHKNKSMSETAELEEVANLKDLRLTDEFDHDKEKPQCIIPHYLRKRITNPLACKVPQ